MTSFSDSARLKKLFDEEVSLFIKQNPESKKLHDKAAGPMMNGVPMSWMAKWPGPYPIYVKVPRALTFLTLMATTMSIFAWEIPERWLVTPPMHP